MNGNITIWDNGVVESSTDTIREFSGRNATTYILCEYRVKLRYTNSIFKESFLKGVDKVAAYCKTLCTQYYEMLFDDENNLDVWFSKKTEAINFYLKFGNHENHQGN